MYIELPILTKANAQFIKSLSKSKIRKETNRVLVEGIKCCKEVINSNCNIDFLVLNTDSNNVNVGSKNFRNDYQSIIAKVNEKHLPIFQTKNSIFDTLCDAKSPQGIIAIAEPKRSKIIDNQSFVALDNISDPGNVGTIIRTADWFGIKQVILLGNCADKYNPKVIRSSMGSVFRMELINSENNIEIFEKHFADIPIYAASLNASINVDDIDKNKNFGLIVGNESRGISSYLEDTITQSFRINGYGSAESLNVAIATGIALYHLKKM